MRTALQLIGERGADGVTPADVVKHLDMPRARMTACFPSEDAFWRGVGRTIEARMRADWEAVLASDQTPSGRLRSLVAVQAGAVMATRAAPATLFSCRWHSGGPAQREHLLQIRQAFRDVVAQLLRDGRAAGEFPATLDAERGARQIVETFQGLVATWWLTGDRVAFAADIWERIEQIVRSPVPGGRMSVSAPPAPGCTRRSET